MTTEVYQNGTKIFTLTGQDIHEDCYQGNTVIIRDNTPNAVMTVYPKSISQYNTPIFCGKSITLDSGTIIRVVAS